MTDTVQKQTSASHSGSGRTRARSWGSRVRETSFAWAMMTPAVVLLVFVLGIPLVNGVLMSFTDLKVTRPGSGQFVFLDNYIELLQTPAFFRSVGLALVYTVGVVVLSYAAGLVSALLLNRAFRGRAFFRTIYILPWALPLVTGVLVWAIMLDGATGLINKLLRTVGISGPDWLLDSQTALGALVVVDVYHQFPVAMIFLLAGLQSVPKELYEAASVDGAGWWRQLRDITLPGLRGVTLITVLMLSIWAFRRFDVNFLLTNGGPNGATETLIMRTYNEAFERFEFGSSAAMGVVCLLVSLVFATIFLIADRRQRLA